jgi:hypothetical protein
MFAACVAGASLCAGSIHLLLARPGRRRDLRRRSRGNWLGGVLELVTTVAWPALTWCLLQAPFYAPLPALAAVVALLIAWLSGRGRRAELGATRAA